MNTIETLDPSPFKHLIMTIGELPSSFVESMTYYEMVAWLVDYIKKNVVTAINNNALAIQEIQYWISNLDLQDEVDHKLEEMAEDGTLAAIIAEYLNAKAIMAYSSVEEMKAAENLIEGSLVETYGYYAANDGGGAKYKVRAFNNDVPDDAFVIQLHDSHLVAELIEGNQIYAKQVGCYGDDTHDDTAKLQIFFDHKSGCEKIVNKGVYLITDTIYIEGSYLKNGEYDGYDNKYEPVTFDYATFHYDGEADGYSVIIYNMFNQTLKGLRITRNSNHNFVGITSSRYFALDDAEILSLAIISENILSNGRLHITQGIQHITINHGLIFGYVKIDPTVENGNSWTNAIYFNRTQIEARGKDVCVELLGVRSKSQIVFNECDLSYATSAIFDVPEAQIASDSNPTKFVGNGSVHLISCYLDSDINYFKDGEQNNLRFNMIDTVNPSNSVLPQDVVEFCTNDITSTRSKNANGVQSTNVNYIINGNITNHTDLAASGLFGASTDDVTKAYVESDKSASGWCRQLTFNNTNDQWITCPTGGNTPYETNYCMGVILEFTSGKADVELRVGTNGPVQHYTYTKDLLNANQVYFLTNSGNKRIFRSGEYNNCVLNFKNVEADTVVRIYEVTCQAGSTVLWNAPLHAKAVLS